MMHKNNTAPTHSQAMLMGADTRLTGGSMLAAEYHMDRAESPAPCEQAKARNGGGLKKLLGML